MARASRCCLWCPQEVRCCKCTLISALVSGLVFGYTKSHGSSQTGRPPDVLAAEPVLSCVATIRSHRASPWHCWYIP